VIGKIIHLTGVTGLRPNTRHNKLQTGRSPLPIFLLLPSIGLAFTDAELRNRFAREKLESNAAEVTKEGRRWIKAEIELDDEAARQT
jgi:hypothetical protein